MSEKISIHPSSIVDEDVCIGSNIRIWHFCHIKSGARIGCGCALGKDVDVSNNVKIGDGVKIKNGVSVYEGVTLEAYVFCGPSCVFMNALTPRARYPKNHKHVSNIIRHDSTIGANATVVCGHEVGAYATIAVGAVVSSDVPE